LDVSCEHTDLIGLSLENGPWPTHSLYIVEPSIVTSRLPQTYAYISASEQFAYIGKLLSFTSFDDDVVVTSVFVLFKK